jgi:hypothetical protein
MGKSLQSGLCPPLPRRRFRQRVECPGIFTGTILNRENIGKTTEELVIRWNSDNPNDQVIFSAS